ncbi:uncharacterized protein [Aristolochia californica]|uniref:uncharacterized protein n=1 Tax=Aristolochia californica TaxID=171875 RepID=UPI0035E2F232
MARLLSQSQTLIRESCLSLSLKSATFPPLYRFLSHRNRSHKQPEKGQLIEIEIEGDSEFEVLGLRRLEDALHGVIVRRLTPDWLPFLPGSSYWVPPKKLPLGVLEVIGMATNPLTEEEFLSLTTVRGWPSSSYYVEGGAPHQIKSKPKKKATESEDDEG